MQANTLGWARIWMGMCVWMGLRLCVGVGGARVWAAAQEGCALARASSRVQQRIGNAASSEVGVLLPLLPMFCHQVPARQEGRHPRRCQHVGDVHQ